MTAQLYQSSEDHSMPLTLARDRRCPVERERLPLSWLVSTQQEASLDSVSMTMTLDASM